MIGDGKGLEQHGGASEGRQYRICIAGLLDPRWSAWFDGMTVVHGVDETALLTGVVDQAALYGLIAKLRNLGLTLISITRDPP